MFLSFFFFTSTASPSIYTLSLHDALPICDADRSAGDAAVVMAAAGNAAPSVGYPADAMAGEDRKSTRLNSSHRCISYAVFCLKKKKKTQQDRYRKTRIDTHIHKRGSPTVI